MGDAQDVVEEAAPEFPVEVPADNNRLTALEEKVAALSVELQKLKRTFQAFRQQFE